MPRLTKVIVEAIAPDAKPVFVWDSQIPGFGVKVLPTGTRRYIAKYSVGGGRAGQQRWLLLGTHGAITVDQARDLARQAFAAVAKGEDPQAAKQGFREAPTMAGLWDRYEREHLHRKKPHSQESDRRIWKRTIQPKLGAKKIMSVARDDIAELHSSMSGETPYQANRALALLSKMFNLAELWNLRPDGSNPCRHVARNREESRERFLSSDELQRLGRALDDGLMMQTETPYMVAAVRLLLLTGARVSEILTAEWAWVDFERRVIALPDSKTGKKLLYLSEPAVGVLQDLKALGTSKGCKWVCRGRTSEHHLVNLKKPWQRICERADLKEFRLHDLRHTAASLGVAAGLTLPLIGKLLGHTQAQTTQRYAHVDVNPALAAADKIGAIVAAATGMILRVNNAPEARTE